ncbi:MAG: PA2778 family cysteine peptidase [Pseudomonadota bacterium]
MYFFSRFIFLILICIVTACSVLPVDSKKHTIDLRPYQKSVQIQVPFYAQRDDLCGPTALAMAMEHVKKPVNFKQLEAQVYTSGLKGSLQQDMLTAARRQGLLATTLYTPEALFKELNNGQPVILLLNLGVKAWPKWHYTVATGFDVEREIAWINSIKPQEEIALQHLLMQWYRGGKWGMVVTQPNHLPISASAEDILQSAIGLERASQNEKALQTYRAATAKFSNSALLWMGRGNTAYANKLPDEAYHAFEKAIELNPKNGAAYFNAIQILQEQKKNDEATLLLEVGLKNAESFRDKLFSLK